MNSCSSLTAMFFNLKVILPDVLHVTRLGLEIQPKLPSYAPRYQLAI